MAGRADPDHEVLFSADAAPGGDGSKRAARSEEMRTRLLDAAEELYAAEGPSALTNRRIGEQADTTTQSIYTYFGSRDALIDTMFRRAIRGVDEIITLASAVASQNPDESDVVAAFKAAAREYRRFCLAHPARLRMIRTASSDPSLPPDAAELRDRLIDAISQFGRSGTGEQTSVYESRIHLTIASLNGFIDAELEGFIGDGQDPDTLYDELVHRCLAPFDQIPTTW